MQTEWHVYLLLCGDNTFYCGITGNIERRIDQHNGLLSGGAKYTRGRRPVKLVSSFTCKTKSEALKWEYAIKKLSGKKKFQFFTKIINMNY